MIVIEANIYVCAIMWVAQVDIFENIVAQLKGIWFIGSNW